MKIKNVSGEIIPARSFAQITDKTDQYYEIDKPDADSISAAMLCVVATPIPIGAQGTATKPEDGKFTVAYNGDVPSNDNDFGTVENQWYGEKDKSGFKVLGASGGYASVSPFSDNGISATLMGFLGYSGYIYMPVCAGTFTQYSAWKSIDEITFIKDYNYIAINRGFRLFGRVFDSIYELNCSIELGNSGSLVASTNNILELDCTHHPYNKSLEGTCDISGTSTFHLLTGITSGVTFNQIRVKYTGSGATDVADTVLGFFPYSGNLYYVPADSRIFSSGGIFP